MATPKKKHKIRDYDTTRRKLLETVGEILRDTGYTGLKTNNIARRAGKDKSLIRYYFQSLVNLQKAYIKEHDYWFAFFEGSILPENPAKNELKTLFVEMMKANFDFFRENLEMQKIILWQISESNPLMRSVSDQRELEGGKLLGLTDVYFKNSDINFRALIAIILGGTYYLALHAETNKSTVCGIDINLEKDRQAVQKCIEQLAEWAWEHTGEPIRPCFLQAPADELICLEQLALQICEANPAAGDPDLMGAFIIEATRVKSALSAQIQDLTPNQIVKSHIFVDIDRLTSLCNSIYSGRTGNKAMATFIFDIIYAITLSVSNEIPREMILPILFRELEATKLSDQWGLIKKKLAGLPIDPILPELISLPYVRFTDGKRDLQWGEYSYLMTFTAAVEQQLSKKNDTSVTWMSFLISQGFNHSRFSTWCFGMLSKQISGKNKADAITFLKQAKLSYPLTKGSSLENFEKSKLHIVQEINEWIDEELSYWDLSGSEPNDLESKFKTLEISYWEKSKSRSGQNNQASTGEQLKIIEAKLLVMLEYVRSAANR